ncbi:MAG: hypothetical protein NkDv07_0326 [Candidatus Improbicoccus devescovinae]|nr:MAG: hypothetical protein NkDv07_0326 [Candidatus Improbicoccus devescovinae]
MKWATIYRITVVFLVIFTIIRFVFPAPNDSFGSPTWAIILFLASALAIFGCCLKIGTNGLKVFEEIKPNVILFGLCIAIAIGFCWCGVSFWRDLVAKSVSKDLEKQYMFMIPAAILAVLTFIISGFSHLTGENKFKKAQFLVFGPVIYFVISIVIFLALSVNPDAYLIISQGSLALFFVYYSQIFVTCVKKVNIIRRLLFFAVISFVSTVAGRLVLVFRGDTTGAGVNLASNFTYILVGIYAILFVVMLSNGDGLKRDFKLEITKK